MNDEANAITDEILAAHEADTDAYPNTDWVKNYMNTSNSQKHNIVLQGGNDIIKAYVALGYMKQGSMFSDDQYYRRYNVRANLDLKPTKTTTVSADLGFVYDLSLIHIWQQIANAVCSIPSYLYLMIYTLSPIFILDFTLSFSFFSSFVDSLSSYLTTVIHCL